MNYIGKYNCKKKKIMVQYKHETIRKIGKF